MKPYVTILLTLAMIASTPAFAQDAAGDSDDPLTKIFGEGGMDLKAERMESALSDETGELERMRIQGEVVIRSQSMNLDCDDLIIDMKKQVMIATGRLVRFEQQDVSGTCGRMTYYFETGETILVGDPKPSILQKDATGRVTQTSANKITMTQTDKARHIGWEGDTEFKVMPAPQAQKTGSSGDAAPVKIDRETVRELKTPSVGG
jgi:lipopolysaccharide assembly outer membrane protein LptD (OstA)